ncbi:hypothetical protein BCR41DRAFT_398494 [Lobosporangium transversale]|uniref:Uncharacterized protein n=1 Tax=Lobosporangium transversale TaxID=64571 RepID=A0A1Y2GG56_9FUNG|nr:hypothetical protein BCR41DRAFT_398494 [Lobosporangium transversale]ORZ09970.1 hypothetical protein BCR41DRAFT_398494 [Lobosporangium transversale]|eukprot:XP_021879060.1 hypothetical protein BCR41DRAFT_398494 [Lobosporangium transversale]
MYCWPASSDMAYPNTTLFLQAVSPPYQKLLDDHEVGQIEGTIEHTFKVKTLLRRAFSLGSSSFERLEAAFEQKTATVNTKSASNGGKWPGNLKAPKALTDAFEALIGAVLMDFELKIMGSNTAFLVAMVPLAPTLFVVDSSMDGHTPTLTRQSPLLEPWLSFTTVPDKSKAWRTNALVPDGRWRACTGILVVTSLKAFGQTQCFSRSIEAVERLEATNFQPFPSGAAPQTFPNGCNYSTLGYLFHLLLLISINTNINTSSNIHSNIIKSSISASSESTISTSSIINHQLPISSSPISSTSTSTSSQ